MYEFWMAEGGNGSVMFDSMPSRSDVLNACEDLERPIEVFLIVAREWSRSLEFTVRDE